eukprot:scaffold631_cov378-Prasinococcus_capsulatus_cf.AAC.10
MSSQSSQRRAQFGKFSYGVRIRMSAIDRRRKRPWASSSPSRPEHKSGERLDQAAPCGSALPETARASGCCSAPGPTRR